MRLKEIIERFTLVSGFEMKDVSRYLPIITDCKSYFEEHCSHELSKSDLHRAEHACAVYAFYRISRLGRSDDLRSFRVGDVQMSMEAVSEAAEKLWLTERESISDILDISGSFAFRSVSV